MRLWLRDSERKPDPVPVRADGRFAILIGVILWLIALIVLLPFAGALSAAGTIWMLWTAVAGLALGILALVIVQFGRR